MAASCITCCGSWLRGPHDDLHGKTSGRCYAAARGHADVSAASSTPVVHVGYGLPRSGLPAAASFRSWVAAALAGGRRRATTELSIRLVDADEGRALNRDFRGKDYATNVLSFPVELPPGVRSPLIGDIVLCAPVVAREALEQGKRLRDHFAHLTVHGVLHLLGHDHHLDDDAQRMEALEVRILARMGIADPYR
jgi:probable rRNA maturation factor